MNPALSANQRTANFLRITENMAACGACHSAPEQVDRVQQMGGASGVTQAQIDASNN